MISKRLLLPDADLAYYPGFLKKGRADDYLLKFLNNINWRQDSIKLFGKQHPQPRLTALFANNKKTYSYSGISMHPEVFPGDLAQIKTEVEKLSGQSFTSCLANLYRNGKDSMGWHTDDEKELGPNPVIASVSLGAERVFHLKHKTDKSLKQKLILEHGSLLLMQGTTQHFWKHQLPKTKKEIGPRINLTFRKIDA